MEQLQEETRPITEQRARGLGGRIVREVAYADEPQVYVYCPPEQSEAMRAFSNRPA